ISFAGRMACGSVFHYTGRNGECSVVVDDGLGATILLAGGLSIRRYHSLTFQPFSMSEIAILPTKEELDSGLRPSTSKTAGTNCCNQALSLIVVAQHLYCESRSAGTRIPTRHNLSWPPASDGVELPKSPVLL